MAQRPPSEWQRTQVIEEALAALRSLETDDGVVLDTPEAVLKALAEDVNVNVGQILIGLARAALDAEAYEEAIDVRIAAMKMRKQRFAHQRSIYRNALVQSLQKLGVKNYPNAEFSLNMRDGEPVVHVLVAPSELPPAYQRTAEVTANKILLRDVLKGDDEDAKQELEGKVVLGNASPVLTIRAK